MYLTQEMDAYVQSCQEELKQLICDICAIPAPSHHEEARAKFCKTWFEQAGFPDVYIDDALNVICPCNLTEDNPVLVFMAHTDTVFPDLEPLPQYEADGRLYCPSVCDDTANLAVMMICARYFLQNPPDTELGYLFVANSCEEGLGNLKGCRALVNAYGSRIQEVTTFDGWSLTHMIDGAVGSHRYKIRVRTEGGHSFGNFGNRNAIAYLSSMISTLYDVKVPQDGNSKTTYNVGTISGGTSVNTIAQDAEMLYEYRSDSRVCLSKMETLLQQVVDAYRAMGISVDMERLGDRPCSGELDPVAYEALLNRAADAIRAITGKEPSRGAGSTDCNIPLAAGIPAVCIGLCNGTGIHTREESLELDSLLPGTRLCMDYLAASLGCPEV